MAITGHLEKMKIIPFADVGMNAPLLSLTLTPMYNPTTLTITSSNKFDETEVILRGKTKQKFMQRKPRQLSNLDLFFDGTGASPSSNAGMGINSVFGNNIFLQIKTFEKIALGIDGTGHRPNFFLFVWGTFVFPGVIETMAVNYTLFDSNGIPLRAKVTLTVSEHVDDSILNAALRLLSPDLTQSRVVKAGDNIHNLAKEMYDDDTLYLQVAKVNNLKNYRKLIPGQTLIFPPIETIKST